MAYGNPDLEWYTEQSSQKGLPPRCPIANSNFCPRFYNSLHSAGEAGIAVKVSEEDKKRFDEKWKDFAPIGNEEEPSVTKNSLSGFCPEVMTYPQFMYQLE